MLGCNYVVQIKYYVLKEVTKVLVGMVHVFILPHPPPPSHPTPIVSPKACMLLLQCLLAAFKFQIFKIHYHFVVLVNDFKYFFLFKVLNFQIFKIHFHFVVLFHFKIFTFKFFNFQFFQNFQIFTFKFSKFQNALSFCGSFQWSYISFLVQSFKLFMF